MAFNHVLRGASPLSYSNIMKKVKVINRERITSVPIDLFLHQKDTKGVNSMEMHPECLYQMLSICDPDGFQRVLKKAFKVAHKDAQLVEQKGQLYFKCGC
jgi:hypothetical protein